ncbi:MAG: hypothetical protein ACOX19_12910 [Fermentimonas sp.]
MYYYIWLNPNKAYGGAEKITMSPTVRNQVYSCAHHRIC